MNRRTAVAALLGLVVVGYVGARQTQTVKEPDFVWHDCKVTNHEGNFAGYQSEAKEFTCKEGVVRLEGRWGYDIQNGWKYRSELGELMGSEYVGDLTPEQQMPKFQNWCKTKYGYTLCGWNDEEEVKQRKLQQEQSHHIPDWRPNDPR